MSDLEKFTTFKVFPLVYGKNPPSIASLVIVSTIFMSSVTHHAFGYGNVQRVSLKVKRILIFVIESNKYPKPRFD